MLLRFGAKNFCSFKDWAVIDMTFNSKVPTDIKNGEDVARVMCLKGANSSGKTSALKIPALLSYICAHSFALKPDEELGIDSFFNNKEPSEFFADFRIDQIEYSYELTTTNKSILSEKIYRKDKRKTLVLSRNGTRIERNTLFDPKKSVSVRENASIISTANQYKILEMAGIYSFFASIASNVGYSGLQHELVDYNALSTIYNENADLFEFAKSKIMLLDPGITNITISSFTNDKNEKVYFPIFTHEYLGRTGELLHHAQSSGTKALYLYFFLFSLTLKQGGVLILDEFDINLHQDILPHLVSMFDDPATNNKKAQLIFSTHNTDVLDFMGKYRTYLFNKENGASYCYRLDEIPTDIIIRNDRPISALYKSGKIGGVPKI